MIVQAPPAFVAGWYFFGGRTFGWIWWWNHIHFIEPSSNMVGEIRCPRKLMCMSFEDPMLLSEIFWQWIKAASTIHISLLRLQQFVSVTSLFPETLQPWLTVNIFILRLEDDSYHFFHFMARWGSRWCFNVVWDPNFGILFMIGSSTDWRITTNQEITI